MKLPIDKLDRSLCILSAIFFGLLAVFLYQQTTRNTYASTDQSIFSENGEHFVTIHDSGQQLTVRTTARTVREALSRAKFELQPTDLVEPSAKTLINANNFHINIYRSRPVLIIDGQIRRYLMTASYDLKSIAKAAGLTLYDGDKMQLVANSDFLETGASTAYQITRQGGRTLTVESPIPFSEETVDDPSMSVGQSKLLQMGEEGRKTIKYQVNFVNNVEVSRRIISETITRQPVPRRTAKGSRRPLPPEWSTCAEYARAAGVSEDDLYAALSLIYHESGCRYWAENASSGAYGIPQALPGTKMASAGSDWRTNPVTQIRWMAGYVTGRYGGWTQAWSSWQAKGWY